MANVIKLISTWLRRYLRNLNQIHGKYAESLLNYGKKSFITLATGHFLLLKFDYRFHLLAEKVFAKRLLSTICYFSTS
jgi:hypothetical protein